MVWALVKRYIGTGDILPCNITYERSENLELDASITKTEVFIAVQAAKRNSAPGPDKVTNSMIRNPNDKVLEHLTQYLNEQCLERGYVPPEWKDAKITTIPKPGKTPALEALRPISLTSCMGKLYVRAIHTRLQIFF